ncbi:hypothetical protein L1887_59130 [Cichorium endivia]|nr:hypothetical protein L1887_59130 [Cichorium endivia]
MGWMGFSSSSAARHAPPPWWLFALDSRFIGIGRARRRGLSCAATSYPPYHGTRPAGERSTSAVGGWVGLDWTGSPGPGRSRGPAIRAGLDLESSQVASGQAGGRATHCAACAALVRSHKSGGGRPRNRFGIATVLGYKLPFEGRSTVPLTACSCGFPPRERPGQDRAKQGPRVRASCPKHLSHLSLGRPLGPGWSTRLSLQSLFASRAISRSRWRPRHPSCSPQPAASKTRPPIRFDASGFVRSRAMAFRRRACPPACSSARSESIGVGRSPGWGACWLAGWLAAFTCCGFSCFALVRVRDLPFGSMLAKVAMAGDAWACRAKCRSSAAVD